MALGATTTDETQAVEEGDPHSTDWLCGLPRRRSYFRPTQFPRGPTVQRPFIEPRDKSEDIYVHNTRILGDARDCEGIDRHCYRRASSGRMKCLQCFDYNFWVVRGRCRCGFDRFDTTLLRMAIRDMSWDTALLFTGPDGSEPNFDRLIFDHIDFEMRIEQRRWSVANLKWAARNTKEILKTLRDVFGQEVCVHREGSVRKNTAIESSDLDLMITLEDHRAMTRSERDAIVTALRTRIDTFTDVCLGRNSIKVTPMYGPAIDLVAQHSDFVPYSPPRRLPVADTRLWGKPTMSLAVSGLKLWWHSISQAPSKVPGFFWEVLVTQQEDEECAMASEQRDFFSSTSGLTYFLQTLKLLADWGDSYARKQSSGETSCEDESGGLLTPQVVALKWTPILPEHILAELRQAAKAAIAVWGRGHDLREAFGL